MRVPRRSPTPRGGGRDRARPAAARGAARPPVRTATRGRTPRPDDAAEQTRLRASRRTFLTRRAAVLALVICALAVSLAYPMKRYIDQRQEVAELTAEVSAGRKKVADLEKNLDRWNDPVFIKRKARERLHFVMPGETGYVALNPGESASGFAGRAEQGTALAEQPWYDRLWDSVLTVDRQPPPGTTPRKPAEHIGPAPTPSPSPSPTLSP